MPCQPRAKHLGLAQPGASGVVGLVQHEVDGCTAEADDTKVVREGEGPGNVEVVGFPRDDPGVDRGGNDDEHHVRREEVGLEEAMEEVDYPEPVRGLDFAVRHVGEYPVLGLVLFYLVIWVGEVVVFCIETVAVISKAFVTGGAIRHTGLRAVA